MRDSADFAGDFRLDLDMPGCFLKHASYPAKLFFPDIESRAGKDSNGQPKDCVCAVYDAPNAYLEIFCPVELTAAGLLGRGQELLQKQNIKHRVGPAILAFQRPNQAGGSGSISYRLFLTRSEPHPEDPRALRLWLSPFPDNIHLEIETQPSVAQDLLLDAPREARVRIWIGNDPGAPTRILTDEIIEPVSGAASSLAPGQLLSRVRSFLDSCLRTLERKNPRDAWEEAVSRHGPDLADHFPPSVKRLLAEGVDREVAKRAVLRLWNNPLHAPLVVSVVASRLADHLTAVSLEDCFSDPVGRARYFTLFIRHSELRAMDRYVGSIPLPAPYSQIKADVLASQYGDHD